MWCISSLYDEKLPFTRLSHTAVVCMSDCAILVLRKLIKNETELFGESLKMLWPCLKQVVNNLENF